MKILTNSGAPNQGVGKGIVISGSSDLLAETIAYVDQLTAQGYTPTLAEKTAINTFIYAGKVNGWYSLFGRLWLFFGGTSATSRVDLITATVQGTYPVAPTISSNGIAFNGSSQYFSLGYDISGYTEKNLLVGWHRRNTITVAGVSFGTTVTATVTLFPRSSGSSATINSGSSAGFTNNTTKGVYSMKTDLTSDVLVMYRDLFTVADSTPDTVLTDVNLSNSSLFFGCRNLGGSPANYVNEQSDLLFVSQNMSEDTYRNFVNSFQTLNFALGRGVATTNRITYEGNSFFSAYNIPTLTNTYLTNAGLTFNTSNLSVAASAITNQAANYMESASRQLLVNLRRDLDAAKDILCTFEGINELYYRTAAGESVSDAVTNTYNAIVDYYSFTSGYAKLGFTCILNTLTPRNNTGTHANYEPARQNASDKYDVTTLNGKLRSEFTVATSVTRVFRSTLAKWANCILIDVGDDPNFGQAGQWADTTYYDADKVHPTATMQSIFSDTYYGPTIRYLI